MNRRLLARPTVLLFSKFSMHHYIYEFVHDFIFGKLLGTLSFIKSVERNLLRGSLLNRIASNMARHRTREVAVTTRDSNEDILNAIRNLDCLDSPSITCNRRHHDRMQIASAHHYRIPSARKSDSLLFISLPLTFLYWRTRTDTSLLFGPDSP